MLPPRHIDGAAAEPRLFEILVKQATDRQLRPRIGRRLAADPIRIPVLLGIRNILHIESVIGRGLQSAERLPVVDVREVVGSVAGVIHPTLLTDDHAVAVDQHEIVAAAVGRRIRILRPLEDQHPVRLAQQTHLGIGQQPDGRRLQLGGLRRTVNRPFGRYGTHRETIGRTHLQPLDGGRRQRRRPFGHPHALFRIQFVIVALGVAHGIPREGERPFGDRAFEPLRCSQLPAQFEQFSLGFLSLDECRIVDPHAIGPGREPEPELRHVFGNVESGHRTTPPCLRRDRERHVDPLRRIAAGLQPHASGRFGRRQIEPRREAQIERTLHIDRSQRKESARSQDDIPAAARTFVSRRRSVGGHRRPFGPVDRFERTAARDAEILVIGGCDGLVGTGAERIFIVAQAGAGALLTHLDLLRRTVAAADPQHGRPGRAVVGLHAQRHRTAPRSSRRIGPHPRGGGLREHAPVTVGLDLDRRDAAVGGQSVLSDLDPRGADLQQAHRIAAVGTPRQQGDNSPKRDENR